MAIPTPSGSKPASPGGERSLQKVVLQLVKRGAERRAIADGQADAVLDPATGAAFLLPNAQRWLLRRAAGEAGAVPDRLGAGLNGLSLGIGLLDAEGTVLFANKAWCAAAGGGPGGPVAEGASFLAACEAAGDDCRIDGLALAAAIRQVLRGERSVFRYEYGCDGATAERWMALTVAAADGVPGAVITREDITERRWDETLLALQSTVARRLAEAGTAGDALKAVIRTVCETCNWDCGRYFQADPVASVLRFREGWSVEGSAAEQLVERSRGMVLRWDVGLKGRVYQSGQPLWVLAGTRSGAASLALPPASDSDGAFVFGVARGSRTLGVLAFSGRNVQLPGDRMLEAVRAIGSQLGAFLERQEEFDGLRADAERFRRLTLLSADWYWRQDPELRFTEQVGAAAFAADDVLGKRLWELPNVAPEHGDWSEHRAQLGQHWSFRDFAFTACGAHGQVGRYTISGEPVLDKNGGFSGYWGTGMITIRPNTGEA